MTRSRVVVLCAALGVINLASFCNGALGPGDDSTGLNVTVRRGPITPTSSSGQDSTAPVDSAVVLVTGISREAGFSAYTDAAGHAGFSITAGDYSVSITDCPGAVRVPEPVKVTVSTGKFSSALMVCDTGIR